MIHDAIVKFDSIGIFTVLLCISIGTDREEDCTQINCSDALIAGTSQP